MGDTEFYTRVLLRKYSFECFSSCNIYIALDTHYCTFISSAYAQTDDIRKLLHADPLILYK